MGILKPLRNLIELKSSMKDNNWCVDSFYFTYNKVKYVVLVNLYLEDEKKTNEYASVKLNFFDTSSEKERKLFAPANVNGLLIGAKDLREYFGIQWNDNLGDILKQFSIHLGKVIPTEVIFEKTDIEEKRIIQQLSSGDSEDPNKLFCYMVKRNGTYKKGIKKGERIPRSPYNTQKTKMRRLTLFEYFKNEPYISFCYSVDKAKEKNDTDIIKSWNDNKIH